LSQLHISEEKLRLQEKSILDLQRLNQSSKTEYKREIATLEAQIAEYQKLKEANHILSN
jgi:hypothetical protein